MPKSLALFDFDGTITSKDTLPSFLKYCFGSFNYFLGLFVISPYVALMKIGLYPAHRAKEKLLIYHLSGYALGDFEKSCANYNKDILPNLIRPKAASKINEHQAVGDLVYIVSASPRHWIEPFANSIRANVIATELEVINGRLTGKIVGENCKGIEKVKRINAEIDLSDFDSIYAYGDSIGDLEMLELANYPEYKPFH